MAVTKLRPKGRDGRRTANQISIAEDSCRGSTLSPIGDIEVVEFRTAENDPERKFTTCSRSGLVDQKADLSNHVGRGWG